MRRGCGLWPGCTTRLCGWGSWQACAAGEACSWVTPAGASSKSAPGPGSNVAHYPDAVHELVLTEPELGMRRKLARRLDRHARTARILDAPAERLPLPDASVDTVVSTLVLCTVDDPESALREVARVLRPNGRLLFIEHVRAKSSFLAACQDKLLQSWRVFAGGCVCNRPTLELMRACGFAVEADDVVWHGMRAIVHPLAVGCAARLSVGHASR